MTSMEVLAILSVVLTFSIFLATVIFHTGKLTARVEQLEAWRGSIRQDMHEISETLGTISQEIKTLTTLIDERTERRNHPRT